MHPQLQNAGRIAHDVGLATWFGGQVFGKFSLNPVVAVIDDEATRGKVVNTGWFTFNPIGLAGLAVGGGVHVAARRTEVADRNLRPVERRLARAQDVLLATSALLTVATGVQGARLAKQAPDGAVPLATGKQPSPATPPKAVALQRSVNALGAGSLLSGAGLLVFNALLDRVAFTDPPTRPTPSRCSRPPRWSAAPTGG
jgi:hypothetical protein